MESEAGVSLNSSEKKIAPTDVHQRLREQLQFIRIHRVVVLCGKMCLVFLVSVVASMEINNILLLMLFFIPTMNIQL